MRNHDRLTICCIAFLSGMAMTLGYMLLAKGYQTGEILVTSGGVAGISGLVGFLGGRSPHPPGVEAPTKVETTTTETKDPTP